jgi:hypothetical protein
MTTTERLQYQALVQEFSRLEPARGTSCQKNQAAALRLFKNPAVSHIAEAIPGTEINRAKYRLLISLGTHYNFEEKRWRTVYELSN